GNDLKPRAERLIYRRPAGSLHFALSPDKTQYAPGEPVRLTVTATNETGRPVPAVGMVAVGHNRTVGPADGKNHRGLPTQILVTSEVRKPDDLEYADVLLGDHSKATAALDLLLGTQGWRRFIEQTPDRATPPGSDEARMIVMTGRAVKQVVSHKQELLADIERDLGPELQKSRTAWQTASNELQKLD